MVGQNMSILAVPYTCFSLSHMLTITRFFEAKKVENSWNIFIRKAFDLPFNSHRYLIEAISNHPHLKRILILRFMSFLKQIQKSSKSIPKQLLNLIWKDTRSITGSNIRGIRSNWAPFNEISRKTIQDIDYHSIP